MTCLGCGTDLEHGARDAFDPWLGRLWRVCPTCRRWNVVPLETRWERLESLERAARSGAVRIRTEHLDLVATDEGELIRVGRAPRPEMATWRYGDVAPPTHLRRGGLMERLRRFLLGIPLNPMGYDAGHGMLLDSENLTRRWIGSPFFEDAPTLTAAFLHVPFARACPSCGHMLPLEPWSFQGVRFVAERGDAVVVVRCGRCRSDVALDPRAARPALRLGLGIVNRRLRDTDLARAAGVEVDAAGGAAELVRSLASSSPTLGDLGPEGRLALGMALDEAAEAELLEREWAEAEELAGLVDGVLSHVEGFEEFRRGVLE